MKRKFTKTTAFFLVFLLLFAFPFFCGCKGGKQINKLSDLEDKIIAVEEGSIHDAAVESSINCNVVYKNSNGECISQLLTDKIDGVAMDYLTAKSYMNKFKGILMIEDRLNKSEYGFGFNKKDSAIREQFSGVIEKLKNNGEIEKITDKWLNDGEKTVLSQTWQGLNGTLTCQVAPNIEPICYLDDNNDIVGIDVDIILTVAKELDYKIIFEENDFYDLEPAIIAGEPDFIASGLTITAERKRIDFTVGYLDASTVILVLDRSVNNGTSGLWSSIRSGFKSTFMDKENGDALINGLLMTLSLIAVSMVIGLISGIALFFLYYYGNKFIQKLLSVLFRAFTLMPISTWLLICYYLIFPARSATSYMVAVFGLAISFTFQTLDCFISAYHSIPKGQTDAAITIGYTKRMALKKIILPQMLPNIISALEICSIYHVKDTSLVGFIAVQDIQAVADAISVQTAEPFFPIMLTAMVYVLFTLAISSLLKLLKSKLFPDVIDVKRIESRVQRGVKND